MTDENLDLRPEIVNIGLYRGDAWAIPVTITGADLTGAVIAAQLRARPNDDTILATLDIAETDLPAGQFHYGQQAATQSGHYDVQITPAGGLPRTYIRGRLTVTADVTRP